MAFRKIKSSFILNENEYEQISELFNIPQDTISDDDNELSEEIEQKSIVIDQDLFNELPFSFD